MPDPVTRFPSEDTLAWVAAAVGRGARVRGGRRLIGGVTSSLHVLTVEDRRGERHRVVLRRYVRRPEEAAADVRHEAEILTSLWDSGLPVPRLLAADPEGEHTGGVPTLLMTRVTGHVHLTPRDPDEWLRQMAAVLPRIHALAVDARPYKPWIDAARLDVPAWSALPDMWRRAIEAVRNAPSSETCFIHRDFQHFNLLWSRERLTGIVDWADASNGPPDIDVGHCRLNLAVLFSAEWAERFRAAYEAETGRRVDPHWDLTALMAYGPSWATFIPKQVGGLTTRRREGNERPHRRAPRAGRGEALSGSTTVRSRTRESRRAARTRGRVARLGYPAALETTVSSPGLRVILIVPRSPRSNSASVDLERDP